MNRYLLAIFAFVWPAWLYATPITYALDGLRMEGPTEELQSPFLGCDVDIRMTIDPTTKTVDSSSVRCDSKGLVLESIEAVPVQFFEETMFPGGPWWSVIFKQPMSLNGLVDPEATWYFGLGEHFANAAQDDILGNLGGYPSMLFLFNIYSRGLTGITSSAVGIYGPTVIPRIPEPPTLPLLLIGLALLARLRYRFRS